MNDQIETAVEASSELAITVNSPAGYVVIALAAYGAKALTNDARRAVVRFRENRKARKEATETVEPRRSEA
jgi:hypothetical protein